MKARSLFLLQALLLLAFAPARASADDPGRIPSKVTVAYQAGDAEAVTATATAVLEDNLILPIFIGDDSYLLVEVDIPIRKDGKPSAFAFVDVEDPTRWRETGRGIVPIRLFQGSVKIDWANGDEVTLFESGPISMKLSIEPVSSE